MEYFEKCEFYKECSSYETYKRSDCQECKNATAEFTLAVNEFMKFAVEKPKCQ